MRDGWGAPRRARRRGGVAPHGAARLAHGLTLRALIGGAEFGAGVLISHRGRYVHTLNTDWVPDGFTGYRIGAGVGGWCEPGEEPPETAVREAREETLTNVALVNAPHTWLLEHGHAPTPLEIDDRPAPLAVSRFANTIARGDAYGVMFLGVHDGELAPGDDVLALLLLPIDVWPGPGTPVRALVAAGGIAVGDVDPDAAVWPHPDDEWPLLRIVLPK